MSNTTYAGLFRDMLKNAHSLESLERWASHVFGPNTQQFAERMIEWLGAPNFSVPYQSTCMGVFRDQGYIPSLREKERRLKMVNVRGGDWTWPEHYYANVYSFLYLPKETVKVFSWGQQSTIHR